MRTSRKKPVQWSTDQEAEMLCDSIFVSVCFLICAWFSDVITSMRLKGCAGTKTNDINR